MLMFRVADARETGMIGMNDGLVVHMTTVPQPNHPSIRSSL